jgi:hypothetical protein
MKTDLEKFKELYQSVGIELQEEESEVCSCFNALHPDCKKETVLALTLKRDNQSIFIPIPDEKIIGQYFLHTSIFFDLNGKFIYQGMWHH